MHMVNAFWLKLSDVCLSFCRQSDCEPPCVGYRLLDSADGSCGRLCRVNFLVGSICWLIRRKILWSTADRHSGDSVFIYILW